ncbi:MAG: hypothetical protein ACI9BO_002423, partial [Zhongshania sp.]
APATNTNGHAVTQLTDYFLQAHLLVHKYSLASRSGKAHHLLNFQSATRKNYDIRKYNTN